MRLLDIKSIPCFSKRVNEKQGVPEAFSFPVRAILAPYISLVRQISESRPQVIRTKVWTICVVFVLSFARRVNLEKMTALDRLGLNGGEQMDFQDAKTAETQVR